jgi:hypothetical protein
VNGTKTSTKKLEWKRLTKELEKRVAAWLWKGSAGMEREI